MALQFPDMRGLLGAIMMFTLRTFSASRPLEKEFESFQAKLAASPPTPPPGSNEGQAAAQSAQAVAQLRAQTDTQTNQADNQTKMQEINARSQYENMKIQQDHQFRMGQLALQHESLQLERQRLGLNVLGEERAHQLEQQRTGLQAISDASDTYDKQAQRQHEAIQNEADRQNEGNVQQLVQEYRAELAGKEQEHQMQLIDKQNEQVPKTPDTPQE
jgi:hypothetical protein